LRKAGEPEFSGVEYEQHILSILSGLPQVASARRIGQSGDCGGDLLFTVGSHRVVAQVKRYSGNVGSGAVQEVFAAKANYDCTEAVVVTNSAFTQPARRLAKQIGVRLVQRADLAALRELVDTLSS
jgi:restriction system protein